MSVVRSTLQITLWHDIWRMSLDGRFFGDYRSREDAVSAAEAAQAVMVAIGGLAEIVITSDE